MNDKLKSKEVEQLFEAILSLNDVKAVSYTHLTLPTNSRV